MLYLTLLHYLLLNFSLFLICQLTMDDVSSEHRMDHQSDILLRAAKKF